MSFQSHIVSLTTRTYGSQDGPWTLHEQAGHQTSQLGLQTQNNHNKLTLKYISIVCGVRQQS